MAKCFLKSTETRDTETRDELSSTCTPKVMSRCLSMPDTTSLSLPQEQAATTIMALVVRIQVFSIMDGVANTCI